MIHPVIMLATVVVSAPVFANGGVTYPVVEPDALAEVESQVEKTDWQEVFNKDQDSWAVFKGVPLPAASQDNQRFVLPIYTNEIDVPNVVDGGVLYPAGYQFNILQYIHMPFRILIARPEQADWMRANARATDVVVFTHGNMIKAREQLGFEKPMLLNAEMQERFELSVAPTIITQSDQFFLLTEIDYATWKKEQKRNG